MSDHSSQESIAIVGMAGRFPQARNLDEFWRNLREGRECVSFFKDEPLQWLPIEHAPKPDDPRYVRARGVLEKPEWFDAAFFGMNPKEAEIMDPQHRVFLECAWEALEDAGCNPETYDGLIGVFAGASMNTYLLTNLMTNRDLIADFGMFSAMIMNDGDFVPTRVSYKLNLRGPSINVQTACSTSLVAVALAAQNLLGYRCDVALAGGVSITFPPHRGQFHLEGGILSKDGHCRTFDAQASGTVLGDGAGIVVLKRLGDAVRDGDRVLAVIKGTAINNDGSVKIGYTAPSVDGQAEVIAMAHAEAGFAPETVSYIEAHGTGTPLGDPIEIAGLTKAFGLDGSRGQFCAVGSVKSNLGHLDIGAGVAGLIKTVLALQHGELPPSLHYRTPNPKIDFANSPFFVNAKLRPWQKNGHPRRAGVSSFGIGGTNAHVAVEEAPAPEPASAARPKQLLVLSAKTPSALEAMTENLAAHLEKNAAANAALADVAWTLQVGRKVFGRRRAVVCETVAEAVSALRAKDPQRVITGGSDEAAPTVAFMFPGQGAQAVNMARGLYESEAEFRATVDRCSEILQPKIGADVREILFPREGESERAARLLTETRITQPAMFVIEYALAQLWIGWGITPAAMIGHSLGEYVAATIAGVFSLEDALALVAERARLMQAQPPGAMLAIRQSEAEVAPLLGQNLALAAVNAPGLCVVSGPFDAIEAVEKRLAAGAIASKRLATSHAFHSAMMEPALPAFRELLRSVKLHAPTLPWVSNLTGRWITPEEATSAEYWVAHLRRTVRFADGVESLLKAGHRVLLEVGPGQTLAGLARQHPATKAATGGAATVVATLGNSGAESDLGAVLHALGQMWVAGVVPNWREGCHRHERRRIVSLPTYPFERKRYWIEPGMTFALGEAKVERLDSKPLQGPAGEERRGAGPSRATAAEAAGESPTIAALKRVFHDLSGIELADAEPQQSFYELGFDSLFLTQASLAVARHFGVEVTFRQLREDLVTFAKLAAYIEERAPAAAPPKPAAGPKPVSAPDQAEIRLPLTDAQREMWFASQMGTVVSMAYNEESTLQLGGELDVPALHAALRRLVARHQALRTTFTAAGDAQIIAPAREVELPLTDLSDLPAPVHESRAQEWAREEVERPFDFVRGPLFRAALLRLERRRHQLVLVVHHIICDGWSLGTLVRELGELYAAEISGRPARLPEPLRFSDYAQRLAALRTTPGFAAAEKFWKEQFADAVPVLELPTDRPRPAERTFAGGFVLRTVSPEVAGAVKRLAAERGCTVFTTLLATFNVLLHRLAGQEDLVVGVPSASQVMDGLGNLVGHFANLLPIRSRTPDTARFADYLDQVQRRMTDAVDHWLYPFTDLVRQLKLPRDASRVPLANVVFNSSRLRGNLRFGELEVEAVVSPKQFVNFDLNFNFAIDGDALSLGCYYSRELFEPATIVRWIQHFETLLRAVAAAPEAPLGELPLLTEAEKRRLVVEWNDTALDHPRDQLAPVRFAAQARVNPGAIAVVHAGRELSYAELAARAEELAAELRRRGVGPEVPVALCLERSFDMIVAVLAVLQAGGAYVPLDPAYPAERLAFMLEDSRAPVVLTQRALAEKVSGRGAEVVCLDDADRASGAAPRGGAEAAGGPSAENLAYVIYTSGSTGRPKGVAMPHGPLANLLHWQLANSRVGRGGRTLQFASLSFDVSFQEIFSTLAAGGTLVLVDELRRRDPCELWRLIVEERIERLFLPFVALQQLAESFRPGEHRAPLKEIITAGEPLQITPKVAAMFEALGDCTLHNQYGPTEAHVVTALTLAGAPATWPARPAIGRPIANTQIYLLDPRRQPVPIGVAGELCVGGECLARGYLHRDDLTREKFVAHPFVAGARVYRTGDLARYRPDGNIEFIGRIDHQVKLNGYRIELGEIEAVLASHPAVRECAVVVRADPSPQRLVAYVVTGGVDGPGAAELRAHLQRSLPDHMVPTVFVSLERLPLTPSGKVDRGALPAPALEGGAPDDLPSTMAEELLAQIWCEVLGLPQVGVNANFFELGGHSLLAARVLTRIQDSLGVELPLARFFATPHIAALAAVLEDLLAEQIKKEAPAGAAPANASRVDPAAGGVPADARPRRLPLTAAQREIWFASQLGPEASLAYHESISLRFAGPLGVDALHRALRQLVARHDALRTTFDLSGETQLIAPKAEIELPLHDYSTEAAEARAARGAECTDRVVQRAFDLVNGPLFRAALLRFAPQQHQLVLVVHHIICDGWSLGVLVRELSELYSAERLHRAPALPAAPQLGDYAERQTTIERHPQFAAAEAYWKNQFADTVPALELPADRPRPASRTYAGDLLQVTLAPDVTAAVKRLCAERGCTMFAPLLAAFNLLLHRLSGQDEVVVGVPVAGQVLDGLENLVGHFANLLPVRSRLAAGRPFDDYLAGVRDHLTTAVEHWRYPFGALLQQLDLPRDGSRVPLASVVFNSMTCRRGAFCFAGVQAEVASNPKRYVNFDLNFNFAVFDDAVHLGCCYSTELFDEATIRRWLGHYETLLRAVAHDSARAVEQLPLLSEAERQQLLVEWNSRTLPYRREACIHELFAEQAARTPDAIAVVAGAERLSYRELRARSEALAVTLRAAGVGPDRLAGIFLDRGAPLVVAMLAVLEAGGAYVPLDPSHPPQRIAGIVADARMGVIVTQRGHAAALAATDAMIVCVDETGRPERESPRALGEVRRPNSDHLAYVIYTSGSTGQPKGVCLAHRGVVALIAWAQQAYSCEELDGVLFATAATFDVSVFECLVPLCLGGKIIVAENILELPQLTAASEVRLISGVPSAVAELARSGRIPPGVRTVNVAGEPCPQTLVEALGALGHIRRVIDVYGPTETTVYSTGGERERGGRATIGRPLPNEQVYILDRWRQPVPIGVAGELHIAGDKLARGYLNRPELTKERFMPNPFAPSRPADDRAAEPRMYRTGDLARWRPDGTIEYLGRIDHQVKVRGFRIELGEIEAVLAQHPRVREAVVVAQPEPGGHGLRLVGYVVAGRPDDPVSTAGRAGGAPAIRQGLIEVGLAFAAASDAITAEELRGYLRTRLPDYMVPPTFVLVDALPRTSSGKVDRRALPDPEPTARAAIIPPRTTTEELLVEIWRGVLAIEELSVDDNFFEVGGHSLLATQVISRIHDSLGVELTMRQFFAEPTVAGMAAAIESALIEEIRATTDDAPAETLALAKE